MKKRYLTLAVLCACLLKPVIATEGIDDEFTSNSSKTWGERFLEIFQRPNFNKSYAVVVGISRFDQYDNLATKQDPTDMKDYLLNEAGFDYVRLLTEDKVTTERVRQIMVDELRPRLGDNDRLLFYWSGHGDTMRSNQRSFGHLPLAHSKANEFGTMLDMRDLAKWDTMLNAKQTFYLLDACFSGGAGVTAKSSQQNNTLKQIARPSRQILTAGLADEETIVLKDRETSVFTLAVLEGLRGKADFPIGEYGKDGIVSARELELYVKQRVDGVRLEAEWKKSITPLLTRLTDDEGDFFFFSPQTVAAVQDDEGGGSGKPSNKIDTQSMSSVKPKPERLPFEPEMVTIPAGTFIMGCVPKRDIVEGMDNKCYDDELPAREVKVAAFQIGKYEVTFDEWDACEQAKVCPHANDEGWGRGKRPVINVSWNDVQVYLKWLNEKTGKHYRLPTETEWEYAARGGKESAYPWGTNKIDCTQARYGKWSDECKNSDKTVTVGSYAANGYGLYDTAGNVWEWTASYYRETYSAAEQKEHRVLRGGSWYDNGWRCRSALRSRLTPDYRLSGVGFRFALGQ